MIYSKIIIFQYGWHKRNNSWTWWTVVSPPRNFFICLISTNTLWVVPPIETSRTILTEEPGMIPTSSSSQHFGMNFSPATTSAVVGTTLLETLIVINKTLLRCDWARYLSAGESFRQNVWVWHPRSQPGNR